VQAVGILGAAILIAVVAEQTAFRMVRHYTRKTETDLDDEVARLLRRPIILTVLFAGVAIGAHRLPWSRGTLEVIDHLLMSGAIIIWAIAAGQAGSALLNGLAAGKTHIGVLQPRTVPFFDIILKTGLFLAAVYAVMVTWDVDIAGWLASAGIVGIVLGLAAKDSLANLFAGIFILADAPFQVGDWVVIDADTRGKVTDIGFRSTRLLTADGIEVTVPNSVIGNATLINESGGPSASVRVCAIVEVAYETELEGAIEVLNRAAASVEGISSSPAPTVQFHEFGASGLVMRVFVWISNPSHKIATQHALNSAIYAALSEAEISIPFPQQDLYIKSVPRTLGSLAESKPNP